MRKQLAALVATGAAIVGLATAVVPQSASAAVGPGEDRQQIAPAAGWWTYTGLTAQQVGDTLNTNSARLTDINVDMSSGSPRFTVTEVSNSGAYASGWWWYYNVTPAQVVSLANSNTARPIVANCYLLSGNIRCATVMVSNTGANAEGWSFWFGNAAFINSKVDPSVNRLVSLGRIQGTSSYSAVFGSNTGSDAVNWHYYYGRTIAQVSSLLSSNNARLVDLDENNDTGTYNVIMYANTTRWYWYVTSSLGGAVNTALQQGQRVFDVTRFKSGATTFYAVVTTRNTNDATEGAFNTLAPTIDSGKWGFELKRLNGGPVVAGLQTGTAFEPASALKVLYHYVSIDSEEAGATADNTSITYHYDPSDTTNPGICPDNFATTRTTNLLNADARMMQYSDNRMTRGILERYGKPAMLARAAALGMTSTSINHNIGCPTASTHNFTSLDDLDRLYEAFQDGTDISSQQWRAQFRTRMLNQNNYSGFQNSLCPVVAQEAASLGKPASTATSFCNAMTWIAKGGSYQYGGGLPWTISWANGSLTSLPAKARGGGILPRYYFYGDYVDGTTINTTSEQNAISTARGTAYQELMRPLIRSALQTW